jgi:hypothetical protein
MPRKNYTSVQIISKLREAEVLLSQGQTAGEVCRSFNISDNLLPMAERIRWDPDRSSAPVEGTGERELPTDIVPMPFGKRLAGQPQARGAD